MANFRQNLYRKTYNIDRVLARTKGKLEDIVDSNGLSCIFLYPNKCPLCKAENSFEISYTALGFFKCINCKKSGDIIQLLQHANIWTPKETIDRIGRYLRMTPTEEE